MSLKSEEQSDKCEKDIEDPFLVDFSPNDPENPLNWERKRKWTVTLAMSCLTFISPTVSSIVAPATVVISEELNITSEVQEKMVVSIYILGYAIAPLFLSPLSEIFGRRIVLQVANIFFVSFNIGCGFAQTKEQLIIFRFLCGLGGAGPLSIGGGILSDIWRAEERGKAISIYSLWPVLGPTLGPIIGGFITQYSTWRWVFWATSLANGPIMVVTFLFLHETFVPVLLERKTKKLIKETGNKEYHHKYQVSESSPIKFLGMNLLRPFRLMFTQPIIIFLTAFMAFIYGTMYLVITSFAEVWVERYHESLSIGCLNYIALMLGFLFSTQLTSRMMDKIYKHLKSKNDGKGKPEMRVPLIFMGGILIPIGLFWYGWSAQAAAFWILPDIGIFIFGFGTLAAFVGIQTYTIDAYTRYAASAFAAVASARSLCGFLFPLFAPSMYNKLDYGWGNSVLAFAGLLLGLPAAIVLWFYGHRLRALSKYAVSHDVQYTQ